MMAPAATTSLERVELQWAQANPQGEADQAPNGALALWNFAIGSADLKPEHEAALRAFVNVRLLARSSTSFVVSGFASRTGPEADNNRLAARRATTVVQWLDALGFSQSTVAENPGIHPVPGDDGRSLARNRRVEILSYDKFPTTAPTVVAPEFVRDQITATQLPVRLAPPPAAVENIPETETAVPDWIPRRFAEGFTLPDLEIGRLDNEWVKARFRFEGAFRVVGGDRRSRITLSAAAKETNRIEASGTVAITEWLAFKLLYEQPNTVGAGPIGTAARSNVRVGLTATGRAPELGLSGEIEVSIQPLRFPEEFVYVSIGVSALVPVTLFGQQITLSVTGKLKATGVPGPRTLQVAARIAATAARSAVVAAPYAAAVVILGIAFIIAIASGIEATRQAALRHAQRIAGRDAFAARVAFEVIGGSAQAELESLMTEWRRFLDAEVTATAGRCYADAGRQIEALRASGSLEPARTAWIARFGQASGGTDLSFHGVRIRIFEVLGGYAQDGPIEFDLEQLS